MSREVYKSIRVQKQRYAFTYNNYTPQSIIYIKNYIETNCSFGCFSEEIAPSTGTPHLQGYIEYSKKKDFNVVCRSLKGCHLEPHTNGSKTHNINYCKGFHHTKSNILNPSYWSFGDPTDNQGTRTDLNLLTHQLYSGDLTLDHILLTNPNSYHTYGRTLEKINDLKIKKLSRSSPSIGFWFYGESDIGKSYRCSSFCKDNNLSFIELPKDYYKHGWFDNYSGQDVIIINDFRGKIPYPDLLNLVDENQFHFSRRGHCPFPCISKYIMITSPFTPIQVYKHLDDDDDIKQLIRRFNIIHCIDRSIYKVVSCTTNTSSITSLYSTPTIQPITTTPTTTTSYILQSSSHPQPLLFQPLPPITTTTTSTTPTTTSYIQPLRPQLLVPQPLRPQLLVPQPLRPQLLVPQPLRPQLLVPQILPLNSPLFLIPKQI
jgi:hypothetical protein